LSSRRWQANALKAQNQAAKPHCLANALKITRSTRFPKSFYFILTFCALDESKRPEGRPSPTFRADRMLVEPGRPRPAMLSPVIRISFSLVDRRFTINRRFCAEPIEGFVFALPGRTGRTTKETELERKKGKKIKEVLTHYRHFGYKRRFILKFKLHFITAHEKEIHFPIRVF
jgi:hypothetical protein